MLVDTRGNWRRALGAAPAIGAVVAVLASVAGCSSDDDYPYDPYGYYGYYYPTSYAYTDPYYMYGYPGVSFLTGAHGKQLNVPAERSPGEGAPKLIHLAAGGKAHADLLLVNTANFATGACKPQQAAGVRIYPPDETAAAFAAYPVMVCSVNGVGTADVFPVATGPGP